MKNYLFGTEWISYQDCTHEIPESLDRDGN